MPIAHACRGCGYTRVTVWTGFCPGCNRIYNIRQVHSDLPGARKAEPTEGEIVPLCDVAAEDAPRTSTLIPVVDRILGNNQPHDETWGAAVSQMVMIYGPPGSGKSTILMQICQGYAKQRHDVIYFAGEERLGQIKARADRIGKFRSNMLIVRETDLDSILDILEEHQPKLYVIDSIQTVKVDDFNTGSPAAISVAGQALMDFSKGEQGSTAFIVAQITKDGGFSGPKALEHFVDTSLFMKGHANGTNTLSCENKNRYGSTPVYGHFRMTASGLMALSGEGAIPDGMEPVKKKRSLKIVEIDDDDDDNENDNDEPVVVPAIAPAKKSRKKETAPDTNSAQTFTAAWISPDGIPAHAVLAINCEIPECRGQKERACTSASGVREAGFHDSRVERARAALAMLGTSISSKIDTSGGTVTPIRPPKSKTKKK